MNQGHFPSPHNAETAACVRRNCANASGASRLVAQPRARDGSDALLGTAGVGTIQFLAVAPRSRWLERAIAVVRL